jgi:hypothetical protein
MENLTSKLLLLSPATWFVPLLSSTIARKAHSIQRVLSYRSQAESYALIAGSVCALGSGAVSAQNCVAVWDANRLADFPADEHRLWPPRSEFQRLLPA